MHAFALLGNTDMEKKAFGALLRGATNMVSRHADDAGKLLANKQLAKTLMPKGQAFDDAIMASLPQGVRNAQPAAKARTALDAANMRYPAPSSGSVSELVTAATSNARNAAPGRMSGPYAFNPATRQHYQAAQDAMGGSSRLELAKMIRQHRNSLPPEVAALHRQTRHQLRHAPTIPLKASPPIPAAAATPPPIPAAAATPPPIPAAAAPTAATPPPMPVNKPSGMGMAGSVLGGLGAGYLGAEYL